MCPALLLSLALTADPAKPPATLTIGNPAPKLAAMEFVRGEAVAKLPEKTVTVIEFSGTQCGPCIRFIPHLNALQKQHKDVVFLSVYSEEPAAVKEFLTANGKGIEIRVACDPKCVMGETWSQPAAQEGIPHVFVVGKDGHIAWIGYAWDLDEPLAKIVAGNFDSEQDKLRLLVEQGAVMKRRKADERASLGSKEYDRINKLVIDGKHADALKDTEKALAEFADSPEAIRLLRDMRLYLLIVLPDRRDEAFKLAVERAVEAKASEMSSLMSDLAVTLLNAVEQQPSDKRDKRLIDLALPLLSEGWPLDLRSKSEGRLQKHEAFRQRMLGTAYHLRGDSKKAEAAVQKAIEVVKASKPEPGEDEKRFADSLKRRTADLEATLKGYTGK